MMSQPSPYDEDYNLYADENEPKPKKFYTTYIVTIPSQDKFLVMDQCSVTLAVFIDGLVNIDKYSWFRCHGPTKPRRDFGSGLYAMELAAESEIWEWLQEWGFVKLIALGPEDSEYFATKKLTGFELGETV